MAAAISSSTLHQLFRSKATLIAAVYEEYLVDLAVELSLEAWVGAVDGLSPARTIEFLARRYLNFCLHNAPRAATIHSAILVYPEIHDRRGEFDAHAVTLIKSFLWERIAPHTAITERDVEYVVWMMNVMGGRAFGWPNPIVEQMNSSTEEMIDLMTSMCLRAFGLSA